MVTGRFRSRVDAAARGKRSRPVDLRRPQVGALLLLLVATITGSVAFRTYNAELRRADNERKAIAAKAFDTVTTTAVEMTASVRGGAGLVDAQGLVGPEAFDRFGTAVRLGSNISSLGYERIVPLSLRPYVEAALGLPFKDRSVDGATFVPAQVRDEYFAVSAVTPSTPSTRAILGFDISVDERGRAARLARITGMPAVTAPLRLAPQNDIGVLVIVPLYKPNVAIRDASQRVAAGSGFISAAITGEVITQELQRRLVKTNVGLTISDGPQVISSIRGGTGRAIVNQLRVLDRTWTVAVIPPSTSTHQVSWFVILTGGFWIFVVALLIARTVRHERVLEASDGRIRTLAELTQRLSVAQGRYEVGVAALDVLGAALGTRVGGIGVYDVDSKTVKVVAIANDKGIVPPHLISATAPISVPPGGPTAEAIATRRRVTWSSNVALSGWGIAATEIAGRAGVQAAVHQPLLAGDTVVGFAMFTFRDDRFIAAPVLDLLDAAAPAIAQALARATLFEQQRDASIALQNALLDRDVPVLQSITSAARYRPSVKAFDVGGDWYDIVTLPRGLLGIAVGDAVGRGIAAAAVMGQLRSALAAIAQTNENPVEVIRGLDRYSRSVPGALGATVCYAVLDPHRGALEYAVAGHPPPIVLRSDGTTVSYLEEGRITPLGTTLQQGHLRCGHATLRPGDLLLMYTDGLMERRGESLDVGFERLRDQVVSSMHNHDLAEGIDQLIATMTDDVEQCDDLAVIAVRIEGLQNERFMRRIPADAALLHELRTQFRLWLDELGTDPQRRDDMVLALGEAAANAIEHGYRDAEGDLVVDAQSSSAGITVEVRDFGAWHRRSANPSRNRGLHIIRALTHATDIDRSAFGTTVRMRWLHGSVVDDSSVSVT